MDLIAPERYEGVEKTSVGFKLLASMGWAEGQGLGKEKQGIKKHLTVKKKFDNMGVGTVEADKRRQDWTLQMVSFNSVLSGLTEITSQHSKRVDDSDSDDSYASDASIDLTARKAGKRKAAKMLETDGDSKSKKKVKQGKGKREAGKPPLQLVSVQGELRKGKKPKKAAKEGDPKSQAKSVSHLGRFKKREKAKCVRSYSSTDLAAILGEKEPVEDPFASFAAAAVTVPGTETAADQAEGSGSDSDKSDEDTAPSGNELSEAAVDPPADVVDRSQDTSAWWASVFHRGGGLGSKQDAEAAKRGFSEADQENLYNITQAGATKGKQGLGRSGLPKKVAGARFAGKKTKLADSDDEGDGGGGKEAAGEGSGRQQQKTESGSGRGTAATAPSGSGANSQGCAGDSPPAKGAKKWKKIVVRVIREAGGSMKLKAMQKAALSAAGVKKDVAEAAVRELLTRVKSSSAFVVDGKVVSLKKAA